MYEPPSYRNAGVCVFLYYLSGLVHVATAIRIVTTASFRRNVSGGTTCEQSSTWFPESGPVLNPAHARFAELQE